MDDCVKQQAPDLIPLKEIRSRFGLKGCSPATFWRWATKGVGVGRLREQRIYLPLVYVGRTPYVSCREFQSFLDSVSAAKVSLHRSQAGTNRVPESELRAAGLI